MARSVKEVFEHHLAALDSGDLDELILDYADDACVLTPEVSCVGTEAIREFFEALLPAFVNFENTRFVVAIEGDTVITSWSGESPVMSVQHGVDSFIIRDGKIQRQTFAGLYETK